MKESKQAKVGQIAIVRNSRGKLCVGILSRNWGKFYYLAKSNGRRISGPGRFKLQDAQEAQSFLNVLDEQYQIHRDRH